MKIPFIAILNWIKGNKLTAFFIAAFGVASALLIIKAQGKAKCEDCTPYKEMTHTLLETLKNAPTAFEPGESVYQFAVYIQDTSKPLSVKEWARYKDSIIQVTQKKLDSLKTKKQ